MLVTSSIEERVVTDAQLLARSVDEPDLFSLVYDRHTRDLYRYAARRLGPDLGQDVVADAVVAAFRRAIATTPAMSAPGRGCSGS